MVTLTQVISYRCTFGHNQAKPVDVHRKGLLQLSDKIFALHFKLRNFSSVKESTVPARELHNRSGNVQSALRGSADADSPSAEAVREQTFVFIIP